MTNFTPNTIPKPVIGPRPLDQPITHGDIAIVAVGYQPHKTEWIDHQFQLHAVGLVVSGRGSYRHGSDAPVPIEPGSMFTVFPGPVFTYGPTPGPAWEEYYFCAVGTGVKRWVDWGWFPANGAVHAMATPAPVVEGFRELLRVQRRGEPGDADRAVTLAERLLVEMYHARETVRHARRADPSMAAVMTHCQQQFTRPVDFAELAAEHAMSYSSLRQRIKQITGVPPAQYLIHLRCQKAQALLSDTDLTIKAIGAAVGIPDPYAFSRTFKKCVGLAPDLYRRQTAPWAGRTGRAGRAGHQPLPAKLPAPPSGSTTTANAEQATSTPPHGT